MKNLNKGIIRSMTGYGRASVREEGFSCTVEVKSVNHRYLEVNTKLPDEFLCLDIELKRIVKGFVKRGVIYLNLNFVYEEGPDLEIDDVLFRKLLKLEKEVEKRHGISQPLNIHYILSYPGVVKQIHPRIPYAKKRQAILRACNAALQALVKSREKEGQNLKKDIQERLKRIERNLELIETLEKTKERQLLKTLEEEVKVLKPEAPPTLPSSSEEIVRLKSHLKAGRNLLEKGGVIGRELDFLAQEMHREVNTLSSKALSSRTPRYVVKIKAEIEKIREQALNIE